jgi:uncharacterized membrane protein
MGKIQMFKGLRFIFALIIAMVGIAISDSLIIIVLFSALFILPYGFEIMIYVEEERKSKRRRLR